MSSSPFTAETGLRRLLEENGSSKKGLPIRMLNEFMVKEHPLNRKPRVLDFLSLLGKTTIDDLALISVDGTVVQDSEILTGFSVSLKPVNLSVLVVDDEYKTEHAWYCLMEPSAPYAATWALYLRAHRFTVKLVRSAFDDSSTSFKSWMQAVEAEEGDGAVFLGSGQNLVHVVAILEFTLANAH
uniref:Uncharacterized protein n=1 Tax=Mycena chlorophos TaxID=658473 RepID=A0ABQ0M6A5_MYCCL|nr:predicted protein [Mycena chlorophos]